MTDYSFAAALAAATHVRYLNLGYGPVCTGRSREGLTVVRPTEWAPSDSLLLAVDHRARTPAGWAWYEGDAAVSIYLRVPDVHDRDPFVVFHGPNDVEVHGQIMRARYRLAGGVPRR